MYRTVLEVLSYARRTREAVVASDPRSLVRDGSLHLPRDGVAVLRRA
ncbi:MAG: hypothetical protein HYY42_01955 [Chloroflexi bacterium]|nr:hypothetical protein [Candidatus Rokubacteria bacterium]MBI2982944.1 hypothetical protein [Chloroflexota bacterium]